MRKCTVKVTEKVTSTQPEDSAGGRTRGRLMSRETWTQTPVTRDRLCCRPLLVCPPVDTTTNNGSNPPSMSDGWAGQGIGQLLERNAGGPLLGRRSFPRLTSCSTCQSYLLLVHRIVFCTNVSVGDRLRRHPPSCSLDYINPQSCTGQRSLTGGSMSWF